MTLARYTASVYSTTEVLDEWDDPVAAEAPKHLGIPVSFTEKTTTNSDGETTRSARIRVPNRFPIEAGDMIVVTGRGRYKVADVTPAAGLGLFTIASCDHLV